MKKFNSFFNQLTAMPKRLDMVLTVLFTLGVGSMWGAEVTFTFNTKAGVEELGLTAPSSGNGTDLTANKAYTKGDVSLSVTHGGTNTRVWNNKDSYDLRVYKNGGSLTFSVPTGCNITKIVSTGSTSNISVNTGTFSSGTWTGKASSVTYTASSTLQMKTFTITYETTTTAYTITATSNNNNYGTVSVSGTTITASPKTGYRVSTTTPYSISPSGSATVTQSGNTFTVAPTANTTITINFEALPTYTVNWYVNGTVKHTQTDVEGTSLTNIPTPTTADCDNSKVFVGWTTESSYSNATTAPSGMITNTSGMTMPEGGEDYYAVFATASGAGSTSKTYKFTIAASNFNTTSYTANNNEKTSTATATDGSGSTTSVKWTSYQIMRGTGDNSNNMQWQKNAGYIYNSTDLETIESVTVTSTAGTFTTYYGTSKEPTSGEQGEGNGYFKTSVGNATGYASKFEITFTKTVGSVPTYSDYTTSCTTETAYSVTAGTVQNGSIKFSKTGEGEFTDTQLTGLEEGDDVYFTITPTEGYALESDPVVKDEQGNNIEWIEVDDVWMFEMPSSNVTVSASCFSCELITAPDVTTETTQNSLMLSWSPVNYATSYIVYNYTTEEVEETNETSYTFEGLEPNTEYEWGVESAKGRCYKETIGTTMTKAITITHTITCSVNDETITSKTYEQGATIEFPVVTPCDGMDLVGWTEIENYANETTAPSDLLTTATAEKTTTYYAVFAKLVEDSSAPYQLVEADRADWSGKYLIAYSSTIFADGSEGGVEGMGKQGKSVNPTSPTNYMSNDFKSIDKIFGNRYYVSLEKVGVGYVLKTQDEKYNYHTTNTSNGLSTTTNKSTATNYALNVEYVSSNNIKLALTGNASGAVFSYSGSGYFRFYKDGGEQPVYLYRQNEVYKDYSTRCKYTVTFDANGHGEAPESQVVYKNELATEPDEDPQSEGYNFQGWYDNQQCTGNAYNFATPITDNITLYAKWTPAVYTITYKDQGNVDFSGTHESGYPTQHTYGTATTLKGATKTGYTFGGWYDNSSCTSTALTQLGATDYTSGITLYAKWTVNSYTVTWNPNGGNWGGSTDNKEETYNYGATITKPVDPTRDGYRFDGWGDVAGTMPANNLEYTAQWTPTYTITWLANGQEFRKQENAVEGTALDLPDSEPDAATYACDDKVFVGWSEKQISGSTNDEPADLFTTKSINVETAAKTYYAVFATVEGEGAFDIGQSGSFKLYANVGDVKYYATNFNGKGDKIEQTTNEENASIFYLTYLSDNNYTIQFESNNNYISYDSGTNLKSQASSYTWNIQSATNGKGTWRLNSSTPGRALIYSTTNSVFGGYATSNFTQNNSTYYDIEIEGGTIYSEYVTTCAVIPDPVWGGATIDNAVIPVNCGSTTSNSHAAQISFPTASNYDLYKDITIEVTSGNFIIASSRDGEYTTSVTLSPTQSGDNAGTFANKYVYVRAVAPAQSDEDFTGTITISGKQIETQTINVTADVTCTQYTISFNDQGQTKEVQGFAGTTVVAPEPWVGICTEPIQYVFDGWAAAPVANGTEEYDKVDFSTYTMPDNNTTTLYAVYRYAEDGGDPIEGFVKVTESLSDWSGDYVIVNEAAKKAIGNSYANTNTLTAVEVRILGNKVVEPTNEVIWQIRKSGSDYTMYNLSADKYAYITGGKSENAGLSDAVQYVNISWGSSAETARVIGSGDYTERCFSYYTNGDEWRTYAASGNNVTGALYKLSNKSLLYTSSLVCGEISVEEDNVVVTSTKDQKVKVTVPIKVTSFYNDAVNVEGAGENTFIVTTTENVAVNIDETTNIVLTYTPAEYDKLDNETITLTASNGATTTFHVKGRSLPETFAVVAKVGNMWYALPEVGYAAGTHATAYPVEVDDIANPTTVTSAVANNAAWSLRQVYEAQKSNAQHDRYATSGTNFVLENKQGTAKLLNASAPSDKGSNNYLLTAAQYDNYYSTNPGLYEWTSTTTDLETYTLINVQRTDKQINISTNAAFGLHASDVVTSELRFLPIQGTYTTLAVQVVEWKENSVVIMYNGDPTQTAQLLINGSSVGSATLSSVQKDIAVYELPATGLATNPGQMLKIAIGSGQMLLSIPYIISESKVDKNILPGSNVAGRQEVAKVSDLVILKGGTLTADGAKTNSYKFRNVTVYGGGKLVVPADKGFGVNTLTLRIGGVTAEGNYDYVYPEFDLQGTFSNTSGKINLDYVTTKSQYYTFVAPFEVKTKDIKYPVDIYGSNVEAANRGSFEFQYYDGAARANGEMGWKVVEEDPTEGATLTAHQGYTFYGMPKKVIVNGGSSTRQKFGIHRIPMSVTAANVMTHENSEQTTTVSAYPSQHNINAGWNLIGNPYMSTISGLDNTSIQTGTIVLVDDRWQWSDAGSQANRFIVFPSNDGEWYYTSQASNATLPAFKNFFVQIGDKDATDLSIPRNNIPAAQAPARRAAQEADEDIELAIVLEKDAAHADQLDFLINDAYSAVYDHNADFTKMMNNTQLNLYGLLMEDNLSFVAVDHLTAKTDLAIGYQVPQAGEYTLRLSDKAYVMWSRVDALYVTDHEVYPEVTTNLLEDDYTFQVGNAETNITRFTISIIPSKESSGTTTGVDNLLHHDMQTQKFIYNDQLYILRDGVVYDAMGQRIMTINK